MPEAEDAPGRGHRLTAVVIALLACAALVVAVKSYGNDPEPVADTVTVTPVNLKKLTPATTATRVQDAPRDRSATDVPSGVVVHPRMVVPVFDAPNGAAIAKIGPEQFGDTWLPVIAERGAWVRVLLPSRPNGSSGWLRSGRLDEARSRFLIRVHLGSRTLELFEDDVSTGSWTVAVGATDTPTPTGRTFVLGQLVDDQQSFSPYIVPLGTHSQTLDTYGGGPGTVAIHGWTDPSVFGQAISHGCIRVPDEALEALRTVPFGTAVLIDDA
ncbi:L,D-transpeptidase [Nocardioides sambongensis]|uniref:L,D-transpeptidase n=1 Tax=Nocardioides sambongensis TaxID=2589074 RepID=UPI001128540C|nr:L,D-transpeptidase [Nocardioides sambongensis]